MECLLIPPVGFNLGCACFPLFYQIFSERQILWSLYSVVFHAFTLKLPIQTSLSVAPKLPVFAHLSEKCKTFSKTSTPLKPLVIHSGVCSFS